MDISGHIGYNYRIGVHIKFICKISSVILKRPEGPIPGNDVIMDPIYQSIPRENINQYVKIQDVIEYVM